MSELYLCERKVGGNDGLTQYYYYVPIQRALHPSELTDEDVTVIAQPTESNYIITAAGCNDIQEHPDGTVTQTITSFEPTDDARAKADEAIATLGLLALHCEHTNACDIAELEETIRQALKGGI